MGGNDDIGPADDHAPDEGPVDGDAQSGGPADGGGQDGGPADGGVRFGGARSRGPADGGGQDRGPADGGARDGGPGDRGMADSNAEGGRAGEPLSDDGAGDESNDAAASTPAGGEGGAGGRSAADAAGLAGPADPGELLGEVRAIRRRTRLARHAYWFPLVLFGLLTCASVPFYIGRALIGATGPRAFVTRLGGYRMPLSGFLGGGRILTADSAYYWLAAMLLGMTATVLWYRWRGNRIGLRTPARGYLITGLALIALALLIPVVSGRSLRLPLIWPGSYVIRGTFPLVLIGLGLCVLAWSERSTGLAVIAVGYLAISLVANLYVLNNVLYRLHWNLSPATAALPNVVLPALVLLLSGAGAWVVQRRYRPPAEFEPEG
jgi:hypothetical protein